MVFWKVLLMCWVWSRRLMPYSRMTLCKLQILLLLVELEWIGISLKDCESLMSLMLWPRLLVFLYVKHWMTSSYWSMRNKVAVKRQFIKCSFSWLFFSLSISKLTIKSSRKVVRDCFSSMEFLTLIIWLLAWSSTLLDVIIVDLPIYPINLLIASSLIRWWNGTCFRSPVILSSYVVCSLLLKFG